MSHRFFSTNNKRWYPVSAPPCREDSERMRIYRIIEKRPGIRTGELLAKLTESGAVIKPPRSRLAELEASRHVRSEFSEDLFQ